MNHEAIQSQIDRHHASIAAHNKAIALELEQIEQLKKMMGQEKKPTGIGAVACARRVAGQMKQAIKT